MFNGQVELEEIERDRNLKTDQRIALGQAMAINRLAEAAFPYPMDLSVGKPLVELASSLDRLANRAADATTTTEG